MNSGSRLGTRGETSPVPFPYPEKSINPRNFLLTLTVSLVRLNTPGEVP